MLTSTLLAILWSCVRALLHQTRLVISDGRCMVLDKTTISVLLEKCQWI